MSMQNTNILLCGKTGVGKSSLLNYLLGEDAAGVGHGRPETQEGIFKHPPLHHNNISLTIYDTYGLEPDKEEKWREIIEKEALRNQKNNVRDWFHSVVYCVDAQRARIEDFEVQQILRPLMRNGNRILFVLTKSSLDVHKTDATERVLRQHFPGATVVRVESVVSETYTGKTEQKGREELLEKFLLNMRENILYTAITKYQREAIKDVRKKFVSGVMGYYDEKTSVLSHLDEKLMQEITDFAQNHMKTILDSNIAELSKNIEEAQNILKNVSASLRYGTQIPDILYPLYAIKIDDLWGNDWEDYVASIICSIIIPFGVFFRKYVCGDEVKKVCINYNDKIEEEIKKLAKKMYEHFSIAPMESTYKDLLKEDNVYDVMQLLNNELKGDENVIR